MKPAVCLLAMAFLVSSGFVVRAGDNAPAMMIDGTLHEDLDEPKIEEILTHYT